MPPVDDTVSHTWCRLYRPWTEWNAWVTPRMPNFLHFTPRGNRHLFNCLSSTLPAAHYTWAPNRHCAPHSHAPAGTNVCMRTCSTSPTQHVYWTELCPTLLLGKDFYAEVKSSTWTVEHEKQLSLAFHVGAYSFIHRAQTCEHHCDNYLFQLHLNPKH